MYGYLFRAISSIAAIVLTVLTFFVGEAPAASEYEEAGAVTSTIPKRGGAVTISILQSQGEGAQALLQAVELFTQGREDLVISVQTVPDSTDYKVALRSRLLAGEQVDLFHILGNQEMRELSPYLTDLSGLQWLEGAVPGSLDPVSGEDGKVYGVPYSIQGAGLICNRNIFEVAGIPLADIRSMEDLEEAFRELDGMIQSGELEESFPNLEAVTELSGLDRSYLEGILSPIALQGDLTSASQTAQAPSVSFSAGEGAREYFDLLNRYSPGSAESKARNQQVENGLAIQRVAAIHEEIGVWQPSNKLTPGLGNRLALVAVPLGETGRHSNVFLWAPAYWAIGQQSSEEAKEVCYEFLTWLYQSDSGAAVYANQFRLISPFPGKAMDTGIPMHSQLLGYLEEGRAVYGYGAEYPQGFGDSFSRGLLSYLTGEQDWGDCVQGWTGDWRTMR